MLLQKHEVDKQNIKIFRHYIVNGSNTNILSDLTYYVVLLCTSAKNKSKTDLKTLNTCSLVDSQICS